MIAFLIGILLGMIYNFRDYPFYRPPKSPPDARKPEPEWSESRLWEAPEWREWWRKHDQSNQSTEWRDE